MRVFAKAGHGEASPASRTGGRTRRRRVWAGAIAVVVIAAVTAGLLWWHPWAPAATPGRQKPMEFTTAAGGSPRLGTGEQLLRYKVRAENGLKEGPEQFAAEVDAVLGDVRRGWAADGTRSFQRMPADPVDFTVYLATPETTDRICGQYGLDTGGWVNCGVGHQVVINVKRWNELTEYYAGRPDLYHALAVNHEVGHVLGLGHVDCPGPGLPAPVMMQQIKGLHGCVPNGWPFSETGTLLTGPPVQAATPGP